MSTQSNVTDIASAGNKPAEALFISALIDSGQFRPGKYGIHDDQISAYRDLWIKCGEYQDKAGKAPSLDLVRQWSKTFPYTPDVSADWAADEVAYGWMERSARRLVLEGVQAQQEGDFLTAQSKFREAGSLTPRQKKVFFTPTSFTEMEQAYSGEHIPVGPPGSRLMEITEGGIMPGSLWIYAARPGVGKTWSLLLTAFYAASAGYNVIFHSAEMPWDQVNSRLHRLICRPFMKEHNLVWQDLSNKQVELLVEEWQANSGLIKFAEPKHVMGKGRPLTARGIADSHEDDSISVVDYVAKLATNNGKSFREDWNTASNLVGELSEICRDDRIPLVTASQINRTATENAGTEALSYSDALGQEATFVSTIKRMSERVLAHRVIKYRHGPSDDMWFSRIQPKRGWFEDISADEAEQIQTEDDMRKNR